MLHTTASKGPLGLFACLLLIGASATSLCQAQTNTSASKPPAASLTYVQSTRPAPIAIHRLDYHGPAATSDAQERSWAQRLTPVTILYPGIDLASAVFQERSAERSNPFNNWLAEKWIDRNLRCNSIVQRDPRHYPWDDSAQDVAPQCQELNRPTSDLVPSCEPPALAQLSDALLKVRWMCRLASGTTPLLYVQVIPSPFGGPYVEAVNPASKERSRIELEPNKPVQ